MEMPADKLYVETGIVRCNSTTYTVEPLELIWFLKPAPNIEACNLLQSWLASVSDALNDIWNRSRGASISARLAVRGLQFWALDVVAGAICARQQVDVEKFPIRGCLHALARVSRTQEEGHAPKGTITFVHKDDPAYVQFKSKVPLNDSKHIGKLLAVSKSPAELISDGSNLIGVSSKTVTNYVLKAEFMRGNADILSNDEVICHIVAGELRSPVKDHVHVIKNVLSDSSLSRAADFAADLVKQAVRNKFGCTLVLDPSDNPPILSGHRLKVPSADVGVVSGMASVDGAVQINGKGQAVAFSCILDGDALKDEALSRGARYNSARRFSKKRSSKKLGIVVVSADGPITIFARGTELHSDPWAKPVKLTEPYSERSEGIILNEFAAAKEKRKKQLRND
jgi:hypothetical protein